MRRKIWKRGRSREETIEMYKARAGSKRKRRANHQNPKKRRKKIVHTKEIHHHLKEDIKNLDHPHHLENHSSFKNYPNTQSFSGLPHPPKEKLSEKLKQSIVISP